MNIVSRFVRDNLNRLLFLKLYILSICGAVPSLSCRRLCRAPARLAVAVALFFQPVAAFPLTGDGTLTGSFEAGEFTLSANSDATIVYEAPNLSGKIVSFDWRLGDPNSLGASATVDGAMTGGWLGEIQGGTSSGNQSLTVTTGLRFFLVGHEGVTLQISSITVASQPPRIDSLSLTSGSRLGGYTLTLSGSGFAADHDVYLGDKKATRLSFSNNSLNVVVPAADAAGEVDLVVQSGGGTSNRLSFNYTGAGPSAVLAGQSTYSFIVNKPIDPFWPVQQDKTKGVDGEVSYSTSGLPTGLTIDTTSGYIAGIPSAVADWSGSVILTNSLGSGLIDHIQKITVAAMQIADMKVCAHRS